MAKQLHDGSSVMTTSTSVRQVDGAELLFSGVQTFLSCFPLGNDVTTFNPGNDWKSIPLQTTSTGNVLENEDAELMPHLLTNYHLTENDDHRWFKYCDSWQLCLKTESGMRVASICALAAVNDPIREGAAARRHIGTCNLLINVKFAGATGAVDGWSADDIIRVAFSLYDKRVHAANGSRWEAGFAGHRPVSIRKVRGDVEENEPFEIHSLQELRAHLVGTLGKSSFGSIEPGYARIVQIDRVVTPAGASLSEIDELEAKYPQALFGIMTTDEGWRCFAKGAIVSRLASNFSPRSFCRTYVQGFNTLCLRLVESRDSIDERKHATAMLSGIVDPAILEYYSLQDRTAGMKTGVLNSVLKHAEILCHIECAAAYSADDSESHIERASELSNAAVRLQKHGVAELGSLDRLVGDAMRVPQRAEFLNAELERLERKAKHEFDRALNHAILALTGATLVIEMLHMLHREFENNEYLRTAVVVACVALVVGVLGYLPELAVKIAGKRTSRKEEDI